MQFFLSGCKYSVKLLACLIELKWRGLLPVEILACNLDQGQPNFPKTVLPNFLKKLGVSHRIEYQNTYSIVKDKIQINKTYCSLCSRLRRAHLYRIAREEKCTAVVLGHHQDDILETFFINLFHGGKLSSMPPKLINDEGDFGNLSNIFYFTDCAEICVEVSFSLYRESYNINNDDFAAFSEKMFEAIRNTVSGSGDGSLEFLSDYKS